jgi:hypothetical protein
MEERDPVPEPMAQKDHVEALMKLADFYMQHRKERRELEWRISLAIWAFLAAGFVATADVRKASQNLRLRLIF